MGPRRDYLLQLCVGFPTVELRVKVGYTMMTPWQFVCWIPYRLGLLRCKSFRVGREVGYTIRFLGVLIRTVIVS